MFPCRLEPEHFSDPKVIALQTALQHDYDPFYSGICTIPDYQRLLYYTHDDLCRRVDFSSPGAEDLEALYRACIPAEFGRNRENVLDESYRKAGKMDLTSFSTLLDPYRLGIYEQVSKALLAWTRLTTWMDAELYKLNVYGKGDFSKAHKDTPRSRDMFGSLVIALPTPHEGGQLVLRHRRKEWTVDFADKFANATEPSVCFVAFFSDIEHEVLPVTSGYRVTLTYNLYSRYTHPSTSLIPTPYHLKLKQALVDLVNDKSRLPNGGYLGFGLAHEYVHTGYNLLNLLLSQLKGSDRVLAEVCDELGLEYCLRLFYRGITYECLNLLTTKELEVRDGSECFDDNSPEPSREFLRQALEDFTGRAEGVALIGESLKSDLSILDEYGPWLTKFYKIPATEVMEITSMKSYVDSTTDFVTYGNEVMLQYFYGSACMLVTLKLAESRDVVSM